MLEKIRNSFRNAMSGSESEKNLLFWWGGLAYLASYFLINPLIIKSNIAWFDFILSFVSVIYFCWHIYVLRKSRPKKPKLSKSEKKIMQIKARQELPKKIMRKLLLKEPFTKWSNVSIAMTIDFLCVTHFLTYIL